jgi:hypothetical protein
MLGEICVLLFLHWAIIQIKQNRVGKNISLMMSFQKIFVSLKFYIFYKQRCELHQDAKGVPYDNTQKCWKVPATHSSTLPRLIASIHISSLGEIL